MISRLLPWLPRDVEEAAAGAGGAGGPWIRGNLRVFKGINDIQWIFQFAWDFMGFQIVSSRFHGL